MIGIAKEFTKIVVKNQAKAIRIADGILKLIIIKNLENL